MYSSVKKPESSSSRPAGCYLETSSGALRYNSFKESTYQNKAFEPVCLCGAYQDLGIGMCREGYYAGNVAPGATLASCRSLCDAEDKCTRSLPLRPLVVQWGKKSILCT